MYQPSSYLLIRPGPASRSLDQVLHGSMETARFFALPRGQTSIGSGEEADVLLEPAARKLFYGTLVRLHCRISLDPGPASLEVLSSGDSTFLNGRPVASGSTPVFLEHGDLIHAGPFHLVYLASISYKAYSLECPMPYHRPRIWSSGEHTEALPAESEPGVQAAAGSPSRIQPWLRARLVALEARLEAWSQRHPFLSNLSLLFLFWSYLLVVIFTGHTNWPPLVALLTSMLLITVVPTPSFDLHPESLVSSFHLVKARPERQYSGWPDVFLTWPPLLILAGLGWLGCPVLVTGILSGIVLGTCLISLLFLRIGTGDTELHLDPHALTTYEPNWLGQTRRTHRIPLHEIRSVARGLPAFATSVLRNNSWVIRTEVVRLTLEDGRQLTFPLPLEQQSVKASPTHLWSPGEGPASRFMEALEEAVSRAHEGDMDEEALAQIQALVESGSADEGNPPT